MDEELISKKELLETFGISYGALYRWKRMGLIPEAWFLRRSTSTGQETFFRRDQICQRIRLILDNKEHQTLDELAASLKEKGFIFTYDDAVAAYLANKSYSLTYGARNLRRLIEKEIENPLASAIVTGDKPLMGAHLSAEDGKVKLDTI